MLCFFTAEGYYTVNSCRSAVQRSAPDDDKLMLVYACSVVCPLSVTHAVSGLCLHVSYVELTCLSVSVSVGGHAVCAGNRCFAQ